jgi:hypothetical protein
MKKDKSAEIKSISIDIAIQGIPESLVEVYLNDDYNIQIGLYR